MRMGRGENPCFRSSILILTTILAMMVDLIQKALHK
jgi:hypothetical protein